MLPYQQAHIRFHLFKEAAADTAHRLIEQDIRLVVLELCGQDII